MPFAPPNLLISLGGSGFESHSLRQFFQALKIKRVIETRKKATTKITDFLDVQSVFGHVAMNARRSF